MHLAFKPKAIRQLEVLPKAARQRILRKISWYITQPDPLAFATHLSGYNAYRFRIGHHRVIFDFENDTVTVFLVVGREGAYKNL